MFGINFLGSTSYSFWILILNCLHGDKMVFCQVMESVNSPVSLLFRVIGHFVMLKMLFSCLNAQN